MTFAKTYRWREIVMLILVIAALGIIAYGEVLMFAFWKDDWAYFWCATVRAASVPVCPVWLHPGTNAEFYMLGPALGEAFWSWQVIGITLRIAAAVGVALMSRTVARSRLAGWVSGLLYVTTPIAAETVGWASAHVVNFVVAASTLSVMCWVRMLEHRSRCMAFFAVTGILVSLVADPLRMLPMGILLFFFGPTHTYDAWKNMVSPRVRFALFSAGCIALVVFVFWQRSFLLDTQIVRVALKYSLADILGHAYVFGNYFTSLFHIILGSIVILPHEVAEMSHGFPDTRLALVGLVLLLVAFLGSMRSYRSGRSDGRLLFVFLLWITLFYVPTWLFEPRLVSTGVHRYLGVPAVGWYGLIGWIISSIKRFRAVAIAVVVILLFRQISVSRAYIQQVSPYRKTAIVEAVWDGVDRIVRKDVLPTIFVYTGEEPMKTNVFDISGVTQFAVRRKLVVPGEWPLVTHEKSRILTKLCVLGGSEAVSTIYRISVDNAGGLVDHSKTLRTEMRILIDEGWCFRHDTMAL